MMTYRDRFFEVFQSEKHRGESAKERVESLAQLIFANDRTQDKEDCLVQALEEYELMTGRYLDPTHKEWDDMLQSII